jgi:CBS domain-containing protein
MGNQDVSRERDAVEMRLFISRLLHDVEALEAMLARGMIESGVRRIGAEQELFLVDQAWRPAPLAMEILAAVDDSHFTTELARFNLEINLDPLVFTGDCFSRMEHDLDALLAKVREVAQRHNSDVVLTGILPTLRKTDLTLANMTPKPRYSSLSEAMNQLRGDAYEFRLKGIDELIVKHDSVMLEACCTSFQVHYQVGAEEFAPLYNLAQAVTGPLLAAATNAPLLFGRRLWRETRIPLFQQAVDTRSASYHLRQRSPRVSFGQQWVHHSVIELFQEDLARFRVLLGAPLQEDSLVALRQGAFPRLRALCLHNGTVYRWNRPCFGFSEGKPHLRIENRVLPSGPTVLDEIANAAFFVGLLGGGLPAYDDISKKMTFQEAETNFLAAAQGGLDAQFTWLGGRVIPARDLILQELLPLARAGLRHANITVDSDRYLGIISERVQSGRTGSQWLLRSLAEMGTEETKDSLLGALTAATVKRQWEGKPVHEWPTAQIEEGQTGTPQNLRIEEFMTTDLFTVHPDEPLELVVKLMDWKHIRHIPVEDEQGELVGVISWFEIVHHYGRTIGHEQGEPVAVSTVMRANPPTVPPETSVREAIMLMRQERIDSLFIAKEGRLVGIVTERDILNLSARLLGHAK